MGTIFAAVFLVILVMTYFIVISLKIVSESASKKVNAYFLSKLQEYDEDFSEKMDELRELQEKKEVLKQDIKVLEMDRHALRVSRFYQPRPVIRDTFIPLARYIDNGFFSDYKIAKNLLTMDKEGIIRNLFEMFPYEGDILRYNSAKRILDMLDYDALYNMYTLEEEEQLTILDECLTGTELALLEEFCQPIDDASEFDFLEFLSWLKRVTDEESPILTAALGEEGEDYSYISPFAYCRYDKNVCEGVRIVYQNRLYDYSIYESRKKNEHVY